MQTGRRGHPNRQPRSSDRGGRGGRGRGQARGGFSDRARGSNTSRGSFRGHSSSSAYTPVPAYASIHAGGAVAIVLKQDQPTGHRVSGIVADVLTRGDHPRGVKVRLRDGRVGRVQSLVSEAEGERGEALVGGAGAGLGRDGEAGGARARIAGGRMERDIRDDNGYLFDESKCVNVADTGLFAALEEADRRHEERWAGGAADSAVCPVCGDFEGDEMAVARHVEGHFAE
ncbi:hypothetical protein ACJQWK_07835 [Exserohilum turcicum]|uniref:Uncharacterized protein n=1 Tax=Exserohilum turcicum (strain 28A) TaxID=671987 RepID=R0KQX5_EXST2|nr:uncharacterized protein SETTUDRAFT_25478 [Exserohilum turcica Et28A]EOA90192.1 hypothetical protein SETTUDRAFT_25478 [Exserohilum turcica Et28A]